MKASFVPYAEGHVQNTKAAFDPTTAKIHPREQGRPILGAESRRILLNEPVHQNMLSAGTSLTKVLTNLTKGHPNIHVRMFPNWVNIFSQSAFKEIRRLWYNGNGRPHLIKTLVYK
jgi:hypothetical protein